MTSVPATRAAFAYPFLAIFMCLPARAAEIVPGDVAATLGPDFIFNDAATGGNDNDATNFSRTLPGLFPAGAEVTLTGLAWASPVGGTTATSVTAIFTDPGPDGVFDTSDDQVVGTVADALVYEGIAGTYVWSFDSPVNFTAGNGALRIQLNANGVVRRKTTSGSTQAAVKLSLAGSVSGPPPAVNGTLQAGYVLGSGALSPNGETLFSDRAAIGAQDSDLYANGSVPFALQYADLWNTGAEVGITGIALPLRPVTNAGTLSFDFYDPGADGVFTGTGSATWVGRATASLEAEVAAASAYWVHFDPPLAFESLGTGLVVHIQSDASLRFKIATEEQAPGTGAQAFRVSAATGASLGTNPVMRTSLAGTASGGTPPPSVNVAAASGFWDAIDWDTGGGTVNGGVGDEDTAQVGSYRSVTYRGLPAEETIGALQLGGGTTNRGQGSLRIESGTLEVAGDLAAGRGASENDAFLDARGGTLQVGGDASFGRSAPFADGSLIVAGGSVQVAGDLAMGEPGLGGAMLRFHNPGSSPAVTVGGTLVLGRCSLDLTFDDAYEHVPGTVTTLVSYGARDGQFLNFRRGEAFHCGRHRFRIDYDAGGNSITLTALADWTTQTKPPNVILIFTDDQGYADLQLNGHPDWAARYPMPRLQQLADAGARFTSAYVSGGVCHPSRVGLLTGRYQQRFGSDNNMGAVSPEGMSPSARTVPGRLQALGVRTYGIGKWHLGETVEYHPNLRGFDRWYGMWGGSRSYYEETSEIRVFQDQMTPRFEDENGLYLTDRTGDAAVDFIDEHLSSAPDQPFFMYVSFTGPHGPNDLRFDDERFTRLENDYGLTQADYTDTPTVYGGDKARTELERYRLAGMTLAIDDNIGKILDKLAAENLSDDTLVVYLNDNGGPGWSAGFGGNWSYNFPLRGLKGGSMRDGSIRVPCAVSWPGTIPAGQVIDTPVIALDLMATIVNAGGAPPAARNGLDGLDLLPLLRDGTPLPADRALTWRAGGVDTGGSAIRVGDWKLHIDDLSQTAGLYHIAANPGETNDLAAAEPEIFADLMRRYRAWEASLLPPLYGGGEVDADPGISRFSIAGGLRLRRAEPSLAWLSSRFRTSLPLDAPFHFRFLARPTEASVSSAAKLAYALGDSGNRAGLIRAILDYGAGELRLEDGKSGAAASAPLPAWGEAFHEASLDYRPAERLLTFSCGGATVPLVIDQAHGPLSHFSVGTAAMEGEISTLVPTDGRSIGESTRIALAKIGDRVDFDLEAPATPPFDPALLRAPDLSTSFTSDAGVLIENLGGGRYRATTPTDPASRAEFFIFSFDQP